MTRPNQPATAAVSDDVLFGHEAVDCARYCPGLPQAAVHHLAATQHSVPARVLLDLGTATRQMPRALPVLRCLVQEAVRAALAPVRAPCRVGVLTGAAHDFAPAAPGRMPTLITYFRSVPTMPRPEVLSMAAMVAAPRAAEAITGDSNLLDLQLDWTAALRELIQNSLGENPRAGTNGTDAGPGRSYEDHLADSAFSEEIERNLPVSRAWPPKNILGYLRTTGFARPAPAGRHHEFEAAARPLLPNQADAGVLEEDAVFAVLLASRPGGGA